MHIQYGHAVSHIRRSVNIIVINLIILIARLKVCVGLLIIRTEYRPSNRSSSIISVMCRACLIILANYCTNGPILCALTLC